MKHLNLSFFVIIILLATACGKKSTPNPTNSNNSISISVISPASGVYNTVVTITGTNFSPTASNNVVKFNNINAVVQSATATTITAVVPLGAGTGPISVATNTLAAVTGPAFTYNLSTIVFCGGSDILGAVYWQNGIENTLPGFYASLAGSVYATAISGTDVYFAGAYGPDALYWKNGTKYKLPVKYAPAAAGAMAISGTDIYFAGNDGFNSTVYWKNGTENTLPSAPSNGANAVAIAISGTDLYFAGHDGGSAVYWKNGTENTLSATASNVTAAKAIAVTNQ